MPHRGYDKCLKFDNDDNGMYDQDNIENDDDDEAFFSIDNILSQLDKSIHRVRTAASSTASRSGHRIRSLIPSTPKSKKISDYFQLTVDYSPRRDANDDTIDNELFGTTSKHIEKYSSIELSSPKDTKQLAKPMIATQNPNDLKPLPASPPIITAGNIKLTSSAENSPYRFSSVDNKIRENPMLNGLKPSSSPKNSPIANSNNIIRSATITCNVLISANHQKIKDMNRHL